LQVGGDGLATWLATLAALCPDVGFAPNAAMLSAYGWFDGSTGSGAAKQPVQYSAFGAALSEVELDVLTGERRVLRSSIMYDCGYPLNPGIDLGQVRV
jgi:CO/xanthine dehydrogenase Mo-binding subunit